LLDIDCPPHGSKENALYSADLTEPGKAFSFPLITFRHARSFCGGFITDVTPGGQTEKAHAAYKRAIDIAKMDDPSAQSASLLEETSDSFTPSLGIKRKQCTTLGWRVRKLRQTCNLCTAKAKIMLDWDNPEKRYPLTAKLSRKAIREKKLGTIPKMPNCNPSPSL